MGVDFYPCDDCGETFPDCGVYFWCEDCSNKLCEECMRRHKAGDRYDEYTGREKEHPYCPFCDGDVVSDADLLEFAIHLTGLTREEIIVRYKGIE